MSSGRSDDSKKTYLAYNPRSYLKPEPEPADKYIMIMMKIRSGINDLEQALKYDPDNSRIKKQLKIAEGIEEQLKIYQTLLSDHRFR